MWSNFKSNMLLEINGEFSVVKCSIISDPSELKSKIPALTVDIHLRLPPSTSISVMWVFPKTYSTFPSKAAN